MAGTDATGDTYTVSTLTVKGFSDAQITKQLGVVEAALKEMTTAATNLGAAANADFDADGTRETNADEFAGLAGKRVTLQVKRSGDTLVVYVINGGGFRNADGSFARPASASLTAPTPTP